MQYYSNVIEKNPEKQKTFFAISIPEGKLYHPKTNYNVKNFFIELSNVKISEIKSNLIVIFNVMAIVLSVPSCKNLGVFVSNFS